MCAVAGDGDCGTATCACCLRAQGPPQRRRRYWRPTHWTNCAHTTLLAHLNRWLSDEQVVARAGTYRRRARVPIDAPVLRPCGCAALRAAAKRLRACFDASLDK